MSSISAANGLISGLPIQDLVDSLIAIQRRPLTLLQNRAAALTQRRTALLGLSAQLLAVKNAAARFGTVDLFRRTAAGSSNEGVIVPSGTGSAAAPGTYSFTVLNLATTHQAVSGGFASADATPVGAGVLTLESTAALLNRSTRLSALNAGAGVRAGQIRIVDRAGGAATVDLTAAITIGDVVRAINDQSSTAVRARVSGDRLILEDQTGSGTGVLSVSEVSGGHTATDLGLLGSASGAILTGGDLVRIDGAMALGRLNDGNGVRRIAGLADFAVTLADGSVFNVNLSEQLAGTTRLSLLNHGGGVPAGSIRITNRAGVSTTVDLSGTETIADVKTAIESAAAGVTVTFVGGKLLLNDASAGTGSLTVEEVAGGGTAAALGLNGSAATGALTGRQVYFVSTVADVTRVINAQADTAGVANGGRLIAAIGPDGKSLALTDATDGGSNALTITALNGSYAAADLGLLGRPTVNGAVNGRRLLGGLETVLLRSLNGGAGVAAGTIEITDRAGTTAQVDLSAAQTLEDIIAALNAAGTGISASISPSGLGLRLTDNSGGTGNLRIADVTGTAAADLGIAIDAAVGTVTNRNLQRQYVSSATRLDEFRNGAGVPPGRFRITNSQGVSAVVDLTQGVETTLQDVIDEINSRGIDVTARINNTGDGLILEDAAGGAGRLKVAEDGGTTAAALGILGQAAEGATFLDGSLERRITIGSSDTLNDVRTRIQESGAALAAVVLNDGTGSQPYRLSLTSARSGLDGRIVIDAGETGLAFSALAEGRDAAIRFGGGAGPDALILHSATNRLTNAVPGVTLDLVAASATPVEITVSRDLEGIVADVSTFVAAFNAVVGTIRDLTRFNPETTERGVLQGDSTAIRIRNRLLGLTTGTYGAIAGAARRLSSVGLTLSGGTTLNFDQVKFREAYAADPAAVESLFTAAGVGFHDVLKTELERITDADGGTIPAAESALGDSQAALASRIARMQTLLDRRRDRLLSEFTAAESALARLQQQQSALGALSLLTVPARSNR